MVGDVYFYDLMILRFSCVSGDRGWRLQRPSGDPRVSGTVVKWTTCATSLMAGVRSLHMIQPLPSKLAKGYKAQIVGQPRHTRPSCF